MFRSKTISTILTLGVTVASATPLTSVHPDWAKVALRVGGAATLQPRVTGLAFLSTGKLVIGHWGGVHANVTQDQNNSIVYILDGVTGTTPAPTVKTFATGITDLMGLAVVNDQIFVSGGNRVLQLVDKNNDETSDSVKVLTSFPYTPGSGTHQRHEFTFGLIHNATNNTFNVILSSTKMDLNPPDLIRTPNRGVAFSINAATGIATPMASGFREANGFGFGPNGDLFTNDVAGNWVPTCKLTHVQQGKFYGFHHTPDPTYPTLPVPPFESQPETPPAVHLPDDGSAFPMGSAPSNPLYITTGPYAGQIFMGDVRYGGIQRLFLEKVNGQYQGAVFQWTGGLDAGVFRLAWGPDGMLYIGMIGDDGDWNWNGVNYGLQKLRYLGTTNAFEMQAIRSRPGGLEIEYNKPVGASASAPASYTVQSFTLTSTINYNNDPTGRTETVQSAQLCPDNKRVFLSIANFAAGRVYWVKNPNVRGAANEALWTREAGYSNNAMGTGAPCDPVTPVDPKVERAVLLNQVKWTVESGRLLVQTPFQGAHEVRLRDARGSILAADPGIGSQTHAFALKHLRSRFVVLEAEGDGKVLRRAVTLP